MTVIQQVDAVLALCQGEFAKVESDLEQISAAQAAQQKQIDAIVQALAQMESDLQAIKAAVVSSDASGLKLSVGTPTPQ